MGTGIVSAGLALDGQPLLSEAALGIAAVVWAILATVAIVLASQRRLALAGSPATPAALTSVAATAVVGARLSLVGWHAAAAVLLAFAIALWAVLARTAVGHSGSPTHGISFLLAVAPQSIAVLSARLAIDWHLPWLAFTSLGWLTIGLVMYGIVLARFELRQLLVGRGDQWICGGGLAIAALSCARCSQAATAVGFGELAARLDSLTVGLWIAAVAWLPALVACEAVRPRGWLGPDRWSTVFPLGMYAMCSLATDTVVGIQAAHTVGEVGVWIAFVVWLLVLGGTARRLARRRPRLGHTGR